MDDACNEGGIYTEEVCPKCGLRMKDNKSAVVCPKHRTMVAQTMFVKFGKEVKKRFKSYELARQYLYRLRDEVTRGVFDKREHAPGARLAFSALVDKYLAVRDGHVNLKQLDKGTYKHIECNLRKAKGFFGRKNVRDFRQDDFDKFFVTLGNLSSKTRFNVLTDLKVFFRWLVANNEILVTELPVFPEIPYELGYRKTVNAETLDKILGEIRKEIGPSNQRIFLAFRFLTTYISIRPGELLKILEEDVDLDRGVITFKHHKTAKKIKKPKVIPLLPEDLELLKSLPRSFDKLPLIRWDFHPQYLKANVPLGKNTLGRYWGRACEKVGVKGVDLYGGTRHSTIQFLGQFYTPEEIMRLSMHTTSKAGMRYLGEVANEKLVEGYGKTRRPMVVQTKPKDIDGLGTLSDAKLGARFAKPTPDHLGPPRKPRLSIVKL